LDFFYEKLAGSGGFFERKRPKNYHHIYFLVFDSRPEGVIGEAFEVIAGGGELANFFGDRHA
jgi:hypothetical protein